MRKIPEKITPKNADKILEALWLEELELCAEHPARFIFGHVVTKDEHDGDNPVKPFPHKEYLRIVLDEWHGGEPIQFVAKSRQLMVSWLMCAYATWTARFQPHRLVLFQSKKAEDAYNMVFNKYPNQGRCSFIENNLPAWLKMCRGDGGKWLPFDIAVACSEGTISYPNGSRIESIPQGPAQIEGRVPTLFLNDEASLQDEWRAGHKASLPCLVGGTKSKGRGITVATMRMPSDYGDEIEDAGACDPDNLARGVARFRSKSNVATLRVHYSADPDKDPATERGREWLAEALMGYRDGIADVEWQQHMEINPAAQSGERVLPYWHAIADRVVIDDIAPEQAGMWKLDSGFDWGARNPSVWLVFANDYEGNRYAVHELSIPGNEVDGIAGIARLMKEHPLFERVNGRIQADPSMWNNDQNTSGGLVSKAQIFAMHGVHMQPARAKGQDADDVLKQRLDGYYWANHDADDFEPRLFITRSCRGLIKTLPLLKYEDWRAQTGQRSLKEKMRDFQVDHWDAMKYAEAARPSPAYARREAPVGSFAYLQRLVLRDVGAASRTRS